MRGRTAAQVRQPVVDYAGVKETSGSERWITHAQARTRVFAAVCGAMSRARSYKAPRPASRHRTAVGEIILRRAFEARIAGATRQRSEHSSPQTPPLRSASDQRSVATHHARGNRVAITRPLLHVGSMFGSVLRCRLRKGSDYRPKRNDLRNHEASVALRQPIGDVTPAI